VGFDKVLLIDPIRYASHKKLPAINPFSVHTSYWASSVDYLVDAFRILYEVADPSRTSYIQTYLTAIFSLFHFAGLTASDLINFTDPPDNTKTPIPELVFYETRRQQIFEKARQKMNVKDFPGEWREIAHKHLADLQYAFRNIPNFKEELGSTARRLNSLVTNPSLLHIFGHRQGVSFDRLVGDGWVVLVNVSTGRSGLGILQSRLLATVVINQIISSIERLLERGRTKPYYLYIDEAGQYVTYKLADILSYKRQIGLRTILAHQFLGQLKDPIVRDAIVNCTGIKCGFYIENQEEREQVVKMLGYGGEVSPKDVAYNLGPQKKQEMVLRLNKRPPQLIKVPDVPDAEGDVDSFLDELFESPCYYTLKDIKEDERERFRQAPVRSPGATKSNHRATGGTPQRETRHRTESPQEAVDQKAGSPHPNAQPDVAWEGLFLEDNGDQGAAH
jgi:hypothetical protein